MSEKKLDFETIARNAKAKVDELKKNAKSMSLNDLDKVVGGYNPGLEAKMRGDIYQCSDTTFYKKCKAGAYGIAADSCEYFCFDFEEEDLEMYLEYLRLAGVKI